MAAQVPAVPAHFKQIQHYMKTATEHDKRDVIVAYYCRLYALQKAMEIDKKSPESKKFLIGMMDYLEDFKKTHADNEAVHNEVVGQAHVEQYAIKLFIYADNEDRAGHFGKNVVKSFYTAGLLMDVLSTFGELAEDLVKNRKYAKWKAAYIHKCLQSGETPIAGPIGNEEDEYGFGGEGFSMPQGGGGSSETGGAYAGAGGYSAGAGGYSAGAGGYSPGAGGYSAGVGGYSAGAGGYSSGAGANSTGAGGYSSGAGSTTGLSSPSSSSRSHHGPAATTGATPFSYTQPSPPPGGVSLKPEDYQKAIKFCKHASSALQYEDAPTAIDLLTKALNLLVTGKQ